MACARNQIEQGIAGKLLIFPRAWIVYECYSHAPFSSANGEAKPEASMLLRIVYVGWNVADLLGFSLWSQPIAGQIDEITSVLPPKAQQQVLAERRLLHGILRRPKGWS